MLIAILTALAAGVHGGLTAKPAGGGALATFERHVSVPASGHIVGCTSRALVYGSEEGSVWGYDGARIREIKRPAGTELFGTSAAGEPVFALPSAFQSERGDYFRGDGTSVRCLQDGVWVTLMLPHQVHIWMSANAVVDVDMSAPGSSAACLSKREVVLCQHGQSGDALRLIRVPPRRGEATARTVYLHVPKVRHVRIDGDIILNRSGAWFLLSPEDFKPTDFGRLKKIECPGQPKQSTSVLVRVDPATGVGAAQLLVSFGYGSNTSGAIRDYDATGWMAPFGPDEIAIRQDGSTLALVRCSESPRK